MQRTAKGKAIPVARCLFWSILTFAGLLVSSPGWPKSPQEIFLIAAPSIVVVETRDASGELSATGSGVVISLGEVVTNCHVVEKGSILRVKQSEATYPATIHYADSNRDLCQLSVAGLRARPAKIGSVTKLKTGERVVAIGAPRGWELSISEGLISSLRQFEEGSRLIQTSASISPGSSGGGLFNSEGLLVGITTLFIEDSQNLNFAVPVDWISELPDRVGETSQENSVASQVSELAKAIEEIRALRDRLRGADPDFETKLIDFSPLVDSIISDLPPSEWATALEKAYWAFPDSGSLQSVIKPISPDISETISAAEAGDPEAQDLLCSFYAVGKNVLQDGNKALNWCRRSAEQGYASAQAKLGAMYEEGFGVKQDYYEAVNLYRLAAEQGDTTAQFNLGGMYLGGLGVQQDYAEAAKWYRKAAEQGFASAQVSLGVMYANGQGMQQDYAEAFKWLRKSADQDEAIAQYDLGTMYGNGQGVPQDYAEAVKWYRKAAEQGLANAQYNLGNLYDNGGGVPQDHAEAVKWYRKAAEQGLANAQHNLGNLHNSGLGVPQDYAEAVKWYRKAAEQGYSGAQFNLGTMYGNGQGVRQDYVEAYVWSSLAAASGKETAAHNRDIYSKKLSPEELSTAQKRTAKLYEEIQQQIKKE